ncbi:MAG TPA: hypoxanthine phosphoribosyltransferase [Humisphaera sp.]
MPMNADIERVLITREQIDERVRDLAARITADHSVPDGHEAPEVTIVPILTGAMIFCADLMRHIPIHMKCGLLTVSSYPGASLRTQGSQLLGNQLGDVRGRHVLIVDDILDSGGTIKLIVPIVRELGAASVRSCVLLRKDRPAAKDVHVDYWGFEIPDEFVVGYGLDYNNYYRNLPYIGTLKPAAIERERA